MKPAYYLAVFIYCAAIFALSHMPKPPSPELGLPHLDKIAHFVVFGGLAGLISVGLHRSGRRHSHRVLVYGPVIAAAAYGALDEFHQYFVPPRTTSLADLLADTAGAVAVQAACLRYFKVRRPAPVPQLDET